MRRKVRRPGPNVVAENPVFRESKSSQPFPPHLHTMQAMPKEWGSMDSMKRVVVTALFFALAGYAVATTFGLVKPSSVSIPAFVIFALCPVAVLTITVDPSLTTVLTFLAPLNALVYALVGATVGAVRSARRD